MELAASRLGLTVIEGDVDIDNLSRFVEAGGQPLRAELKGSARFSRLFPNVQIWERVRRSCFLKCFQEEHLRGQATIYKEVAS